jgi:hypothetical protein
LNQQLWKITVREHSCQNATVPGVSILHRFVTGRCAAVGRAYGIGDFEACLLGVGSAGGPFLELARVRFERSYIGSGSLAGVDCIPRATYSNGTCRSRHAEWQAKCHERHDGSGNAAQSTKFTERCVKNGISADETLPLAHRTENVVLKAACASTKCRLWHTVHGTLC